MNTPKREIEERAYAIWAANGHPGSGALDDWLMAEAELARSESLNGVGEATVAPECSRLWRAVLGHARAVITVKDTRGRYLLANDQFEALSNVPRARLKGQTDFDIFPSAQAHALRANDLQVIRTGVAFEFEEVVLQDDGEHTYLALRFPIADPDGGVSAVCCFATDITLRKWAYRCMVVQHAVTRALAHSATLSDAGPRILRAVCSTLGWDVGLLWIVDPVARLLRCAGVWHPPAVVVPEFEQMSRELTLPSGVGLPGQVLATGQPLWIPDIGVSGNFPRAAAAQRDGLHSAYGLPVRNGGEMLGVMEFFSREIRRPDPGLVRVMGGVCSQLSQFIERRHAERDVLVRAREFEVARRIQLGLLPKAPPVVAGFVIAGGSHPAQETGGDYFDFIPLPDGSLGIAVGDASGHGIGAALVIAQTRAFLRARAVTDADVGATLALVNRQLAEDLPADHFATLFLGRLDGPARSLTYGSAGHCPGYVIDDRGEVRAHLGSTGFPLGVDPQADFPVGPPTPLREGDLVLLVTDGILEAHAPDGDPFGEARTLAAVLVHRREAPGEIVAALLRAAGAFTFEAPADDMTAVVIKVGRP
jgi:PAS domain S-box-containing protein